MVLILPVVVIELTVAHHYTVYSAFRVYQMVPRPGIHFARSALPKIRADDARAVVANAVDWMTVAVAAVDTLASFEHLVYFDYN